MRRALPVAALVLLVGLVAGLMVARPRAGWNPQRSRRVGSQRARHRRRRSSGTRWLQPSTSPASIRRASACARTSPPYAVVSTVRHAGDGSVPDREAAALPRGELRPTRSRQDVSVRTGARLVRAAIDDAQVAGAARPFADHEGRRRRSGPPRSSSCRGPGRVPGLAGRDGIPAPGPGGAAGGGRRVPPAQGRPAPCNAHAPPRPPLEQVLGELAAASRTATPAAGGARWRSWRSSSRPVDEPLSAESRVLAWGPEEPKPEAISDLTSRVRKGVPR